MIDAVSDMQLAQREPEAVDETVTHINLGGIRYLAVAPVYALRRAVREYRTSLVPRSDTLSYLAVLIGRVLPWRQATHRINLAALLRLARSDAPSRAYVTCSTMRYRATPSDSARQIFSHHPIVGDGLPGYGSVALLPGRSGRLPRPAISASAVSAGRGPRETHSARRK